MKAITEHQPWGSLIFDERKKIETRSWGTNYRGPLAIHAGKVIDHHTMMLAGYQTVPTGAMLCIVELWKCERITQSLLISIDKNEEMWGNYQPGRVAWHLRMMEKFHTPIPARGFQGLWDWNRGEIAQTR